MPERGSKTSTVPVVWATFGIFSAWSKWFPVASRLVTMDETWLYRYDAEKKQQSMEWRHSGWPHPKKFRVQKSAGKFLASIFCDQDGILHIYYLPKGQTINVEYYSSPLVQFKGFWRKNAAGRSPRWSCSSTTMPRLTGHLQEETGLPGLPVSWSPTLFSGSGPLGLPPILWTEKQLKDRHFSSDAVVIAAAETWLDGQPSDFFSPSGLQKFEQRAKKCTELRGEYVE